MNGAFLSALESLTKYISAHKLLTSLAGTDSVSEDKKTPDLAGLAAAVTEDSAEWTAQVPATPGGGGGHPAQDHADLPQGVLPRRYR